MPLTLPKARSIAGRLFLSSALWSFGILLIAGLVLSAVHKRTTIASFDDRLGVYLRALVADVATPGDDSRTAPGQLGEPQFELTLSGWYWQITRTDVAKPEIRASRSLFAARLPRLAEQSIPAGLGGSRRGYASGPDERRLRIVERVIDTGDQGVYLVQVAATTEEVDQTITTFQYSLLATFLVLALALIGSTLFQLRYGLRPLRRLREGVVSIRKGEAERIEDDFSSDLSPLANELNLMIAANRDVVERARTQVGNLAHALKTPLSVVVNEAGAEPGPLADKVKEQAAIMRDQVAFYLDRARAAARAGSIGVATDVAPTIDALLRTFRKIFRDHDIVLDGDIPASLRFKGEKQDLEEMVGNLVDNAGKWSGGEVMVSVTLQAADQTHTQSYFTVIIDDDGPGLAEDKREAATRRGQRLDESKPGSGLGLSIVTDLASLYGGSLKLDQSPLGGLRAQLQLPSI